MRQRYNHDKYKELGIDVGFLEVLPLRIRGLVSDLARLSAEFLQLDSNIINMYWVWATSRYYVFNTPELLYKDIKGGPRMMLGRIMSGEEHKTGKSLVKIIRKIDPQGSWSSEKYDAVLWALDNKHIVKSMRHAEKIHSSLLVLLYEHLNTKGVIFLQTKYVHQLVIEQSRYADDSMENIVSLFKDTVRMVRLLDQEEKYHQALVGFRKESELRKLHDDIMELVNIDYLDSVLMEGGSEGYPSPPIPGTEMILPITSSEALAHEGRYMHHCVMSYIYDVGAGDSYVYKMIEPERATISINPETFEIQDFKLKYNAYPSSESWDCVRDWTRKYLYELHWSNNPSLYAKKSQAHIKESDGEWWEQDDLFDASDEVNNVDMGVLYDD